MSESKAKSKRYWVVIFLDQPPLSDNFQPGLPHLTIVPWFVSEVADDKLVSSFRQNFKGQAGFNLLSGKIVKFGPRKNVSVNLIRYSEQLTALHQKALQWIEALGGRWAIKTPYVGNNFVPHIRRRRGTRLKEGETLVVKDLYLVEAARREDNLRRVAAKLELV